MFEPGYRVLAERIDFSMVELVTYIAALGVIAAAAVTSTVAVRAAQRKEQSRVLVPVRSRPRNARR